MTSVMTPERRQDHDVDGGVGVEPEEMLEQQRIAAAEAVEHRQAEPAVRHDQQQRHREHRRRQDHDEARRVKRPDHQRQAEPGHARRAQHVGGRDEIDAGRDRAEAGDDDAEDGDRRRCCASRPSNRADRRSSRCRRRPSASRASTNSPPISVRYQLARLSFGKATSGAPIISGSRKLPSVVGMSGTRKNQTMTIAVQREHAVVAVVGQEASAWARRARAGSASPRRRR